MPLTIRRARSDPDLVTQRRPDGESRRGVGSFGDGIDQLIAKTTVTLAEMSCEPGWIGVAASAAARTIPP